VSEIPDDVRARLELVPVETMDDVFDIALSRVIVPQRIGDSFVIQAEEPEDESDETPAITPMGRRTIITGMDDDDDD
jgi:hypothetical protein